MKFFKPEDFLKFNWNVVPGEKDSLDCIAEIANAKLIREGKVVYRNNINYAWQNFSGEDALEKAILINIEPIEKCKHSKEQVRLELDITIDKTSFRYGHYCECGAIVKPVSFEEVK